MDSKFKNFILRIKNKKRSNSFGNPKPGRGKNKRITKSEYNTPNQKAMMPYEIIPTNVEPDLIDEYLSTVMSHDDYTCRITFHDKKWFRVEKYVREFCETKCKKQKFTNVALALAKYNYHGNPNNWKSGYHNSSGKWMSGYLYKTTIYKWTKWIMKNEKKYHRDIADMLTRYNSGHIPDPFNILKDMPDP